MKKCQKGTENTKNHKDTKNHNHMTCCSQIVCEQAFCQFWAIFVPLLHF